MPSALVIVNESDGNQHLCLKGGEIARIKGRISKLGDKELTMRRILVGAMLLASGFLISAGALAADLSPATKRLFDAVWADDLVRVKASIVDGADLSATNEFGIRAVDLAVDKGHYDIAHYLLSVEKLRDDTSASPTPTPAPATISGPALVQPAPAAVPVTTVSPAPVAGSAPAAAIVAPSVATPYKAADEPAPKLEKMWKPPAEGNQAEAPRLKVIGTAEPQPVSPSAPAAAPVPGNAPADAPKSGDAPQVDNLSNQPEKPGLLDRVKGLFKFSSEAQPQPEPKKIVEEPAKLAARDQQPAPTESQIAALPPSPEKSSADNVAGRANTSETAPTASPPSSGASSKTDTEPSPLERLTSFFRSGEAPPKNAGTTSSLDHPSAPTGAQGETPISASSKMEADKATAPLAPVEESKPQSPPTAPAVEQMTSEPNETGLTIVERLSKLLEGEDEPEARNLVGEGVKNAATLPAETETPKMMASLEKAPSTGTPQSAAASTSVAAEPSLPTAPVARSEPKKLTPRAAERPTLESASLAPPPAASETPSPPETPDVLKRITDFFKPRSGNTKPEPTVVAEASKIVVAVPPESPAPSQSSNQLPPEKALPVAPSTAAAPGAEKDLLATISDLFKSFDKPSGQLVGQTAPSTPDPPKTVAVPQLASTAASEPDAAEIPKPVSIAVKMPEGEEGSSVEQAANAAEPEQPKKEKAPGFVESLKSWLKRDESASPPSKHQNQTLEVLKPAAETPTQNSEVQPAVASPQPGASRRVRLPETSIPQASAPEIVQPPAPPAASEPQLVASTPPKAPEAVTRHVRAPVVGPPVQNPALVQEPMIASAALKDVEFTFGDGMQLGSKRPETKDGDQTCVDKSQWRTTFCIEPVKWPSTMAANFRAHSQIYRGEKVIVQYVDGRNVQMHALFPTTALWAVTEYFKEKYGPPTEMPEIWTSLIGAPKRPNRVLRWHSRSTKTGLETLLEIREIDDLRWSAPPDTQHGLVRILEKGRGSVFQLLSSTDLLLVSLRNR